MGILKKIFGVLDEVFGSYEYDSIDKEGRDEDEVQDYYYNYLLTKMYESVSRQEIRKATCVPFWWLNDWEYHKCREYYGYYSFKAPKGAYDLNRYFDDYAFYSSDRYYCKTHYVLDNLPKYVIEDFDRKNKELRYNGLELYQKLLWHELCNHEEDDDENS